ncbi:MAG: class I SAM-dependent methyltransferase [Thermodesulfobacteriota bacterium]
MPDFEMPPWAEHKDMVAFYESNRRLPEDLYPSERRFLPWLAKKSASVLDAGCAAGGFLNIWRHYNQSIAYTGVDVSATLIELAAGSHPDARFLHGNVTEGVPLPEKYADCVEALGWLHWEPEYPRAIRELWRLTGKYLFIDLRLTVNREEAIVGRQKMALVSDWDGATTTPYIAVPWIDLARPLLDLGPVTILGYGYCGSPAETVIGIQEKICFAAFVLEKPSGGSDRSVPKVCLDLPFEWPSDLMDQVRLLPSEDLEVLVPQEPG